MSLLMDALKKAEEAKRQSEAAHRIEPQEKNGGESPGTAPVAPPRAALGQRGLPELPSSLELLDTEFHSAAPAAATEPPPPPPAAREAPQRERAAAQNLFAAKQQKPSRAFPLVLGALVVVAAAGIGGYFWWQMQPRGSLGLGTVRSVPPVPVQPIAIAPPAPPLAPAAPTSSPATPAVQPGEVRPGAESARRAEPVAERIAPQPAAIAEAPSPIRITRARMQVDPTLARAYQAFSAGDIAAARTDYERVLKTDRKNADALHGLAAISLRQGQPAEAESYFLRALEADPRDAAAQAGLFGLKGQVDPVQSESRLKNLLGGQPDSPSLHFALGNLYAGQGRWNEAQQAYFRAYSGDGENPDYLFNLAVSLEQLRQPRVALQYYQGALAAANGRAAGFDKDVAAGRIRELHQQ